MRARVFFSLAAALIVAVALVSASGAATTKAEKAARIDVSTREAVVHYLRSIGVNPKGVVIQRSRRNYAGARCPGKGWSCTSTRHPVVQVAKAGGRNRFACGTGKCAVVQVAATPAVATNTAKCVINTTGQSQTQSCTISQSSSSANNIAAVYENAVGTTGLTQTASVNASITQKATGASNSNTACVYQGIGLTGSKSVGTGSLSVALNAHQNVTIKQDSANGGNSAAQSASSGGACASGPLTQSQTESSSATGPRSITQSENATNSGANVTIDIEQNQSSGFLGSAHGADAANFEQDNTLTAIANTPAGPVSQTQSSPTGGLLGTVNQDSRDPSTIVATQHETQCEDAATSGLTTCDTNDADAPGYSLTQTQYGPEGVWKARKHHRGRVLFSVHKGAGTATQTGNSGDTFTLTQSSKQDNDTGSGQTNNVQGDCQTSGSCTSNQQTTVNGQTTQDAQSGQSINSTINCTGSSCTATPPPTPTITDMPPNPSNSPDASFSFTDSDPTVSFLCQLDGDGYSPCTSPATYSELADGSHTFDVEAQSTTGQISAPASYTWTIATEAGSTVLIAGNGDEGSTNPNDNIASLLSDEGYSVTESSTLPADLSGYGQVWWVSTSALSSPEQTELEAFEQSGGGVFLTGEWDCGRLCSELNAADQSTVNQMVTGGGVTVGGFGGLGTVNVPVAMPVNPDVVGNLASQPNTVTSWSPTYAGGIGGIPASSVFASFQPGEGSPIPVAAAWDRSSTVGGGRLVLFMDINWSESAYQAPNWSDVAENVAFFLSGLDTPPTPSP
jgi:hypothetical protein